MKWNKVILAIMAMLMTALSIVAIKFALREFPPLLFHLLRFCALVPFLFVIKKPKISWGALVAIGMCLGVVHIGLVNLGLFLGASAGGVAFILQTGGFFALLFAFVFFGSKPTLGNLIGMGCGFFGVFWVCRDLGITGGGFLAQLALIGAACTWGLGYVLAKKEGAPSIGTFVWTSLFAIPILSLLAFSFEGAETIYRSLLEASLNAWLALFFITFVSTLGASGILMYLMRTEKVAHVVSFQMLVPCFGALCAFLFLGETLSPSTALGGGLILLGVFLSQSIDKLFIRRKSDTSSPRETP